MLLCLSQTILVSPRGPNSESGSESRVTPVGHTTSYALNMRNGLPYLSKDLFWLAMEQISKRAKLKQGHSWRELKYMIDNRPQ